MSLKIFVSNECLALGSGICDKVLELSRILLNEFSCLLRHLHKYVAKAEEALVVSLGSLSASYSCMPTYHFVIP